MATILTYSTDENVKQKIANVSLDKDIIVANFREEAAVEIDAEIASLYVVPASGELSAMRYLNYVERNIAAGKLLLSVGNSNSNEEISQLGEFFLKEGRTMLQRITDGEIVLIGVPEDTDDSDDSSLVERIHVGSPDTHSTFSRPMSEIEGDARMGVVDSKQTGYSGDSEELP